MRNARKISACLFLAMLAASMPAGGGPQAFSSSPATPGWIDFTLPDARGGEVSLRTFIGKKPVLLIFWATWCTHCKESVPVINRMHTEPPTRDSLAILALDYRESREKVNAFLSSRKVVFPVLLDKDGSVARKYRVVGIPTYILIARNGKIAYRGHEIPEIDRYLP